MFKIVRYAIPALSAAMYRYIDQIISSFLYLRKTPVSTHLSVLALAMIVTRSLSGFVRYCLLESFTELKSCFELEAELFTTNENNISCCILQNEPLLFGAGAIGLSFYCHTSPL